MELEAINALENDCFKFICLSIFSVVMFFINFILLSILIKNMSYDTDSSLLALPISMMLLTFILSVLLFYQLIDIKYNKNVYLEKKVDNMLIERYSAKVQSESNFKGIKQ